MGLLSIFSNKSKKIQEFAGRGAVVVDVRSKAEYNSGHVKGSKNIPLQQIQARKAEIAKWNKPLILCCASGMRSSQATSLLKKEGIECMNGGGWQAVSRQLS